MKISTVLSTALLTSISTAQDLYPGLSDVNHTCVISASSSNVCVSWTNLCAEPQLLSCPSQNPLDVDSCCTETFGGLVLLTQFWSTYTGLESQGQLLPSDTWTLHGLWPDYCNGYVNTTLPGSPTLSQVTVLILTNSSYTQYCDLTRQFDPAGSLSPNVTDFPRNGTVVPPYTGPPISSFIEQWERYDLLEWMNTYWINQGASNADFWAHEFSKHATCYSTFQVSEEIARKRCMADQP